MSELEPRISVLERRADDQEAEMQRTRSRLHLLETDSSVLRMMVEQVAEIRADVKSLLSSRAGDDAVTRWKWGFAGLAVALLGCVVTFVVAYHG